MVLTGEATHEWKGYMGDLCAFLLFVNLKLLSEKKVFTKNKALLKRFLV